MRDVMECCNRVVRALVPLDYMRPADWAEQNIIFTGASDPIQGNLDLSLSPFLRDPINAWELQPWQGLKEVTVVAPEQTGKSLSWECGELWSLEHSPGMSLIYYTSDDKAVRINEEKIEPLIRNVPALAEMLAAPFSKKADCYRLGGNLVYFGGVGARISSFSARRLVADEIDDWQDKKGVNALNDLRKRARAFSAALLYKVCTPRGTETASRIWREFKNSSMGYWHLRCQGCGELTIRSCDIIRLQWETLPDGELLPETIRCICPKCGREHVESEKFAMNQQGGYIHRVPELVQSAPGFQWGALASGFVAFSWPRLAAAQLAAGKTGSMDQQIYFDNAIRGLPFRARKLDDTAQAAIRRHAAPLPEPSAILYRFMAVDTQDDCFYWVIRGMDARQNWYFLACGRADNTADLARVYAGTYHGGQPIMGIVDEGGHRAGEVRDFCKPRMGLFSYKGNPRIGKKYKESEEVKKLLLVNATHYHTLLLYNLYASTNRGDHYFFMGDDLPAEYKEHMASWRANPAVKDGNAYENWVCPSGEDHYFDCEKMGLALKDYFIEKVLPVLIRSTARRR